MLTVLGGLPAWARAEQAPPASVSQQQTELNQFLTYYYQDPQPERAPELLAQLLMGQLPYASRPSDEHHNRGLMIYFFGRIARDHPAVIRRYEALQDRKRVEQYMKKGPPLTLGQILTSEGDG